MKNLDFFFPLVVFWNNNTYIFALAGMFVVQKGFSNL